MATAQNSRSAAEIRESIERNRVQLSDSLVKLRVEVGELADWRAHIRRNQQVATGAAAATGFVVAGGIGSLAHVVINVFKRSPKPKD